MSQFSARAAVQQYWQAANARDWAAFGDLLAEQIRYEVPQTRERVCGREAYLEFNRSWPGNWQVELQCVVAEEKHAVTHITFHVDGTVETGISFFKFDDDGKICHIEDHWPAPYAPPPRACSYIERY